ncbi:unnamed protein product, partial [Effrenium voratum]
GGMLLLLCAALAASQDIGGDVEVVRHTDPRRLLEVLETQEHDEVHREALQVSRRLFDFAGIADQIGGGAKWAMDTANDVQNKVVGVQEAAGLVEKSNTYIEEGQQLTSEAWGSMLKLGDKMGTVYEDFKPLEPAFSKASGAAELSTNQGLLSQLTHCVRSLLSSNTILDVLGSALSSAIGVFGQIKDAIVSIVSKLGGRRLRDAGAEGRRLYDYNQLLEGIDFEWLGTKITGFVGEIKKQSENLVDIDTVLGPMLAKLDKTEQAPRRLDIISDATNAVSSAGDIKAQADRNARAIGKIVPTWQAVEGTAVSMCPSVLATKDTVSNLKCRTTEFVSKGSMGSWVPSEVTNIVTGCPADLPTTEQAVEAGCPKEAMSANVKDVLGENASSLGWLMAVGGGAAGLGVCGAAGAKMMKKDEDTEDEEEDSEEPLRG